MPVPDICYNIIVRIQLVRSSQYFVQNQPRQSCGLLIKDIYLLSWRGGSFIRPITCYQSSSNHSSSSYPVCSIRLNCKQPVTNTRILSIRQSWVKSKNGIVRGSRNCRVRSGKMSHQPVLRLHLQSFSFWQRSSIGNSFILDTLFFSPRQIG